MEISISKTLLQKLNHSPIGVIVVSDVEIHMPVEAEIGLRVTVPFDLVFDQQRILCQIYPLLYLSDPVKRSWITQLTLTQRRAAAIQLVFERWQQAGFDKHGTKNPYASKTFMEFLTNMGWHQSDYLIVPLL